MSTSPRAVTLTTKGLLVGDDSQGSAVDSGHRGICTVCGHAAMVMGNGHPRPHNERRVRLGANGQPEIYTTKKACEGTRHPVEPAGGAS